MRTLIDTCVISEVTRARPNPGVTGALERLGEAEGFLSVITIGELEKGIALLEDGGRKVSLQAWISELQQGFQERILPVDLNVSLRWGQLTAHCRRIGFTLPMADGLIAATALEHRLRLMTRNVKDFQASGVSVINPWDD